MNGHTPGPWEVGPQFREIDGHTWLSFSYQTPIRVGGLRDIALVETSEEDGEANAHLISAAPDLFEACRIFLKRWDAFAADEGSVNPLDYISRNEIDLIRSAVAKACGKEVTA